MITRTRKLSDKALGAMVRKVFEILPDAQVRGTYAGGVAFECSNVAELADLPAKSAERLIDAFVITRSRGSSDEIRFARGITSLVQPNATASQYSQFQRRQADAYFDELALFENPNRNNISGYLEFSAEERVAISREINRLAAPVETVDPEQSAAFSRAIDQNISELQRVSTEFLERAAEARAADEESLRKRTEQLEEAYAAKNAELQAERTELEKRREELNDREPQHERRRLREHLTNRLHATIAEPAQGAGVRERRSHYFYLIAAALFVSVSIGLSLSAGLSAAASAPFWTLSAKSLVAGVVGAAFAWAGLAGLRASAVSARQYEQAMQRYAFDMDRASWVVETILQMSAIEKAQVPDEWLEAVCRDLFAPAPQKGEERRSLDAFAALFDATARAKIGTTGIDFEIDRKGAKKLASD